MLMINQLWENVYNYFRVNIFIGAILGSAVLYEKENVVL